MQHHLLYTDPKTEYATAWRTDVEETRRKAELASCTKILLLLFLATLVLQTIAALLRHYVNPDGITYLYITDLLSAGKLEEGLSNFGVNTFIYMLVFFKRLGLDPFLAGIWWNAFITSLTILPLFGWVRRMFDKRLAIVASLLYAIHPIVLSIGSALMRGPLFWLFFNLVIYATWRGITEVRLRWFILAGCSLTLAIHTRSEAWFLVIPISLWALGRFWFASGYRLQLVFGTILLLAIVPGSIAAMNLTVLKSCPQWGIFRPAHAQQLTTLCEKTKEQLKELGAKKNKDTNLPEVKPKQAQPKTTPQAPSKATPKKPQPKKKVTEPPAPPSYVLPGLRRALLRVVKSYTYLYGIFALIGCFAWRGRRRFAIHSLFLMAVPLFAVVWYRSCENDVSPRYFLPIVFISLPIIASGLLWATQKIASCFCRHREAGTDPSKKSLYWLTGMMAITLMVSCFGAVWGTNRSEQKECELGKWILKQFGPNQSICCINRRSRMAAWYAKTDLKLESFYPVYGPNKIILTDSKLKWIFHARKPRVILCWENHRNPDGITGLFETLEQKNHYGYHVIETGILEEFEPKVIVLVREDPVRR